MVKEQIDAFIVPTDDPHMSEYTAPYFGRREFISGFTGSAGTAIVLQDKALLFTDGRYHNQAELELQGSPWTLMKQGLKDVPSIIEYLSKALPPGSVVGYDPLLHAAIPLKRMKDVLGDKKLNMKSLSYNLIDPVWGDARPAAPQGQIRVHSLEYAGKSAANKLQEIRQELKNAGAAGLVISTLDEIAWAYNIRGSDVPCNPVAVAYALITQDSAELFIDTHKVPSDIASALQEQGISINAYDAALAAVERLDEGASRTKSLIWLDGRTANMALYDAVDGSRRLDKESPIVVMKACKNDAELEGMRACHLRDGAAMAEFFAWLEETLATGRSVSETEVDEKVCEFRESFGKWLEPSFPTIAGVNSNGAIVHYRAVKDTCKHLTSDDMMLLDSGGQYVDGKTNHFLSSYQI